MPQQLPSRGFLADTASALPGAVALCLASLTSGGLGALFAIRWLHPAQAPTLWQMLRDIFSHAVGR